MRAIGSSCTGKITGVSHLGGPFDVYNERVMGIGMPDSPILRIGLAMERPNLEMCLEVLEEKGWKYHARMGNKKGDGTTLTRFRTFHGVKFRDTPDFVLTPSKKERKAALVGELKLARYSDRSLWGAEFSDDIPEGYKVQAQFHCFFYDVPTCVVGVLFDVYNLPTIFLVERDDARIRDLIRQSAVWWKSHVETQTPPPIDATDACATYLKHRALVEDMFRDATLEECQIAEYWAQHKEQLKLMVAKDKEYSNYFRDVIGGHSGISFGDGNKISCKENKHGTRTIRANIGGMA